MKSKQLWIFYIVFLYHIHSIYILNLTCIHAYVNVQRSAVCLQTSVRVMLMFHFFNSYLCFWLDRKFLRLLCSDSCTVLRERERESHVEAQTRQFGVDKVRDRLSDCQTWRNNGVLDVQGVAARRLCIRQRPFIRYSARQLRQTLLEIIPFVKRAARD